MADLFGDEPRLVQPGITEQQRKAQLQLPHRALGATLGEPERTLSAVLQLRPCPLDRACLSECVEDGSSVVSVERFPGRKSRVPIQVG